jgi:hypothetical protein
MQVRAERPRGGTISRFVPRGDDHADLVAPGRHGLVDDDFQPLLFLPVAVDEGLQRQPPLAPAGGGDDGSADVHGDHSTGGDNER